MTGKKPASALNQGLRVVAIIFVLAFLCIAVLTLLGPAIGNTVQGPPKIYEWTLIDSTTFAQTPLDVSNTTSQVVWSPSRAEIAYVVEASDGSGVRIYVQPL